jgi:predicted transposase YbfD/YdcC
MARISKEFQELKKLFCEETKIEEENLESTDINIELLVSLKENAIYITDDRLPEYVYHSVEDILLILIFGIMANCNNFVEIYLFMNKHLEWLKKYVSFDFGIPSLSTIKRVTGMIKSEELEYVLNNSLKKYLYKETNYYEDDEITIKDLKSMDGKTANSSDRKSSKNGKVSKTNAMSLLSVNQDICEATEFISDKTNEIPKGIDLLKKVNIKDCIIVFDAMSTQKNTIAYINEQGGYYIAPVKGNQSTLEEDISLFFKDEIADKNKDNYLKQTEKAHGNVETREYLFSEDIDWLYNKKEWNGLKSIGYAKRSYIDKNGKQVTDTRYYITNLPSNKIELLSKAIRGEWQIENGLHLYLDMVFCEDRNKCFLENSQKNLNLIRKFVLALLKRYKTTTKLSMNSIRFNISMDFENEIDNILKKILM